MYRGKQLTKVMTTTFHKNSVDTRNFWSEKRTNNNEIKTQYLTWQYEEHLIVFDFFSVPSTSFLHVLQSCSSMEIRNLLPVNNINTKSVSGRYGFETRRGLQPNAILTSLQSRRSLAEAQYFRPSQNVRLPSLVFEAEECRGLSEGLGDKREDQNQT